MWQAPCSPAHCAGLTQHQCEPFWLGTLWMKHAVLRALKKQMTILITHVRARLMPMALHARHGDDINLRMMSTLASPNTRHLHRSWQMEECSKVGVIQLWCPQGCQKDQQTAATHWPVPQQGLLSCWMSWEAMTFPEDQLLHPLIKLEILHKCYEGGAGSSSDSSHRLTSGGGSWRNGFRKMTGSLKSNEPQSAPQPQQHISWRSTSWKQWSTGKWCTWPMTLKEQLKHQALSQPPHVLDSIWTSECGQSPCWHAALTRHWMSLPLRISY